MAQALNSVCAVEVGSLIDVDHYAAAIIERCAATLTVLKGPLPGGVLCFSDGSGRSPVLARCARLQCLTYAFRYTPAVWLGLSQLHDVDLHVVSTAAIAAALPRLHSLKAYHYYRAGDASSSVAGFFTDLLPRLRVFNFRGCWPMPPAGPDAASTILPLPLPLLEELTWCGNVTDPAFFRWFHEAQPLLLHAPYELLAECVPGRDGGPTETAPSLLSHVSELRLLYAATPLNVSDVGSILRAAPRLCRFSMDQQLHGDTLWLAASATAPLHPAFIGFVHHRLRYFSVGSSGRAELSAPPPSPHCANECASRLRRTCFPRLREMEINGETFFAAPA
jgi:hypothetical protein